ncbi:MAG: hypothetical protein Q9219_000193 [cf. Caloplaca sp. 3 TL-2023]
MQKLLKRTAQVEKQAARRKQVARSKNASDTRKLLRLQEKVYNKARKEVYVSARRAQREDWNLGPLAPRRDIGARAETYGTIPLRMLENVEKMEGDWKKWGIREGDRVCVVGPGEREKGKIGVVREVKEKAESCKVQGINMVNVPTPDYMKVAGRNELAVQTTEAPLHLSAVRLVIPLPDPSTGTRRDVIVNEITLTPTGKRYISHYMTPDKGRPYYIPWPPKQKPEAKDNEDDTLRIDVEQVTWTPTLLRAPMPSGVIDELRNKYSKFRTRHEDSYIEMKEAIDERATRKKEELAWGGGTPKAMLTPVQELNRMRKMERRGPEENKLTPEVLAGIGELMVRNGKRIPPKARQKELDMTALEPPAEIRTNAQAP